MRDVAAMLGDCALRRTMWCGLSEQRTAYLAGVAPFAMPATLASRRDVCYYL